MSDDLNGDIVKEETEDSKDVKESQDDVLKSADSDKSVTKSAGDQSEGSKLYVGNLPFAIDNAKLSEIFSAIDGVDVVEAIVITDKFNEGRSKGFGFVTVANADQAQKAIEVMNGSDVDGRKIVVNIARPRVDRNDRDNGRNNFRRSY